MEKWHSFRGSVLLWKPALGWKTFFLAFIYCIFEKKAQRKVQKCQDPRTVLIRAMSQEPLLKNQELEKFALALPKISFFRVNYLPRVNFDLKNASKWKDHEHLSKKCAYACGAHLQCLRESSAVAMVGPGGVSPNDSLWSPFRFVQNLILELHLKGNRQ